MINLEDKIGLSVIMGDNYRLEFGLDVELDQFSVRKFSDLGIVAKDKNLPLSDEPAYLMYRNVRQKGDSDKIKSNHLRFDLTVIPPAKIGDEYVKTSGHYHPKKPGTEVAYPELYYVILGQATYLNQKPGGVGVEDAIISRVNAGQAIVTPPNYGHVTINELDEPIVMANWVCDDFKSVYGDYEDKSGAAYYLMVNGKIEKNSRYENLPEIRELKSNPRVVEKLDGKPIYNYLEHIEDILFLKDPQNHVDELKVDNLFQS